jgi:hypothetical protein
VGARAGVRDIVYRERQWPGVIPAIFVCGYPSPVITGFIPVNHGGARAVLD